MAQKSGDSIFNAHTDVCIKYTVPGFERSAESGLAAALHQRNAYLGRDELGYIPAHAADFPDETRGNVCVGFSRGQEDGFHIINQMTVHVGQLKLVFEVGDGAKSPE